MPSLNDFLAEHARSLSDSNADAEAGQSPLQLSVVLKSATEQSISFSHLGAEFSVDRADVLSVGDAAEAIPNPSGGGVPCKLQLKPDALLRQTRILEARRVAESLPFVMALPSLIPSASTQGVEAEIGWLSARGLPLPPGTMEQASTTYTGTQSSQFTGTSSSTSSAGYSDDTSVDDSNSDGMGRDDANADDVSGVGVIELQSTGITPAPSRSLSAAL